MAGTRLETLPSQVVSFRDFKSAFPQGTVMLGHLSPGNYNYNPYYGYDSGDRPSGFFTDELDTRLRATERVVGIQFGGEVRAYPFEELAKDRVVNEMVGGKSIVIFYEPTAISPLDQTIVSDSRSVGAASVFLPSVGDQDLTFNVIDGAFLDRQTGSTWNILGQAVDGRLKGQRLQPLFNMQSFWFYWAAISPETTIYKSSG